MKYLFSDLDGTIIFDKQIKKEYLDMIKEWRAKGNHYYICTGRPLTGIHTLEKKYPDFEYDGLILQNGALILDSKKNIVYQALIEAKDIKVIIDEYVRNTQVSLVIESSTGLYAYNQDESKIYDISLQIVNDYDKILMLLEGVVQISLKVQSSQIAQKLVAKINDSFDNLIAFDNLEFVDIVKKEHSKGTGIAYVIENNNLNKQHSICIGDGGNDISMFDFLEHSYSFEHAFEHVKSKANFIVDDFCHCLEKYL